MSLFDKRLVVVTGKGGVGRSTLAAALGVAAAERGKRALVVEFSGTAALPPLFGLHGRSFAYRRATDNVWISSLTVPECVEDFARRKLHLSILIAKVVHTQTVTTFIDAIPGLHDLLQLGKIENLLVAPADNDPSFDIVFIDAPATGHGLTLLSAARSMSDIAKAGPFHDLACIIDAFLRDPEETAIVVATLPEALPVSETHELLQALADEHLTLGTVIANRCDERPLPEGTNLTSVTARLQEIPGGPALAKLAEQSMLRWTSQQEALATLQGVHSPIVQLPRVPTERRRIQLLAARLLEAL